jgi:replicative DNA helicase
MKLSQPIHRLRRQAKSLSRTRAIPLGAALDVLAQSEGYNRWSHLAAAHPAATAAEQLLGRLAPGDLVLVAGRRGEGKTLLALETAHSAARPGSPSHIYSLEFTRDELGQHLDRIGANHENLVLDCSDGICAATISEALAAVPAGTLVVIDYLQALDHDRRKPALNAQISALKATALSRGLMIIFICQVDRSFLKTGRRHPDLSDIRLPNPLDVSHFAFAAFVSNGAVRFQHLAPIP